MKLPTGPEFASAFDRAPQYVKDFMDGPELDSAFASVRTEYKLHIDEAGVLADILNAVILELLPIRDFETALIEHIPRLGDEERALITKAVNEKIFAALRTRATPHTTSEQTALAQATPAPVIRPTSTTPAQSVTAQKLTVPTHEVAKIVSVPMPSREGASQTSSPQAPRYVGGGDPYREPVGE